jgi:hypothetical protein
MTTLTDYQLNFQELVHDPNNVYYSVTDMNNYINRARLRVAGRSQCVRFLASGGTITAITINSGGSGYSGTATVSISGAGQQAAATATISGGAVNTITLVNGGWGYITGTTVTVTVTGSTGGSNATFNVTIDNSLTTIPSQEVYQFSLANTLLEAQNIVLGLESVEGIISVAIAWGANAAMKPMMMEMIWSEFQAYYRSYNTGLQNYPTIWSKYGQGINGSIYVWPLPSQFSQMDWDCWCLPEYLVQGAATPEAIPYPFTTPVPYYAAYLAFFNAQRFEDADRMKKEFEEKLQHCPPMSTGAYMANYYEGDY